MTRSASVKLRDLLRFKEEWESSAESLTLKIGRGKIFFRSRWLLQVDAFFDDNEKQQYGHTIDGLDIVQSDAKMWRLDPYEIMKDGSKRTMPQWPIVLRADTEYSAKYASKKQSCLERWSVLADD